MAPSCRLRRLTVRKYRHLAEPADLVFGDDHVGVVGRNGGGKTNLLLLVDAAVRGDFTRFASDPTAMDVSVELALGEHTLHYELTRSDASSDRRQWRLAGTSSRGGGFQFDQTTGPEWDPFTTDRFVERPPTGELRWDGGRFDESLGAFLAIERGEGDRDGVGPSGLEIGPARSVFRLDYVPWDLHRAFYDAVGEDVRARPALPLHLPWTERMCAAMDVRGATLRPRFQRSSGDRSTFLGFDTEFDLRGGTTIAGSQLSYGQKRIFAFFWHAAVVGGGVIVADELANGLHHDALEACLGEVRGQGILATQNPLLLDHLGFDGPHDLVRGLVLCAPTDEGWSWRNPTDTEADRFHSAYSLGFQHVSELLREKRLW
jgi:hypothetical protein